MIITTIENRILVGVGDIKIDKAPKVLSTYLGSCVAVCLYSSLHKAGGMIHILLPKASVTKKGDMLKKEKYADTGIPELLRRLKTVFNLEKEDFVAKIFGGANVLKISNYHFASDNITESRSILDNLGIRIISSNTGGERGYKIDFDLNTGKVLCQIFGDKAKEY